MSGLYKKIAACMTAAAMAAAFTLMCGCTEIDESLPEETSVTEEEKKPYPVTIGSLVFNASPETAASLSPAMTEIICELGFKDRLSGRSVYCSYPSGIESLDTLGSAANPDTDAIRKNAPKLLLSHSPIAKKDITAIENGGIRVLIISAPASVDGLKALYSDIYRVFAGQTDEEAELMEKIFSPLDAALEENKDTLGSYVYILSPELAAASDSTFAGSFFSNMGKNAAGGNAGNSITAEELLEADPKYIILPPQMTAADLPEEISGLTALDEGRVIILDEETAALLERPTSRIYLAAERLKEKIAALENESAGENTQE